MNLEGKRLVAVFAHPDDECFGPGGTFGRYGAAGVEMTLVCATRGEAGSIGHSKSYEPALLARIRQAELEMAIEVLGFRNLHILGYPDGGVEAVPSQAATADVLAVLRAVEPDAVIAFHPLGISGHPDHKAMTAAARAAVHSYNREMRDREGASGGRRGSPIQLHYYTIPASVVRQITFREMPLVPDEEITVELDTSSFADVKRRAIHCHKTQLSFLQRLESVPGRDGRLEVERYVTEGARRRPQPLTDLFMEWSPEPGN